MRATKQLTASGLRFVLATCVFACSLNVLADVPPEQEPEVAHLLSYVRYANCDMVRNGVVYSSREGYKHVLEKYDYFRKRIESTEDFIDLAATKSLLSGKEYMVECRGQDARSSAAWLREELHRYRACVQSGSKHCDSEGEQSQTRR